MSQENVEIVKRSINAVNERDVEAYICLITDDFELLPAMTGFGGESFSGRHGMERYFTELDETWEVFQVIAEEFRDLGESVLVVMRLEARGGGSGLPITGRQGLICEFRGDKLSRVRSFLDHADALRAAGLSE